MNVTNTTTSAKIWREQGPDPGALVWVFISIYLFILLCIAIYSWFRTSGATTMNAQMRDYFLANGKIGDIVLMLTMFSTVYSGYTVVGVPQEMYDTGFYSYRWLFTVLPMVIVISFFGARLNYLTKVRGYISPTAFISDRYNSHLVTIAISATLVYPTIIYVLAQFDSMSSTVEGISGGKVDGFYGACVLCAVMLTYELFGGLRAISWTDALQGGVMTIGFLIFYAVQAEIFEGVESAGNYMESIGFNKVLNKDQTTGWFSFGCSLFFAYAFYPQLIQRYQAATTSHSFRKSMIFLTLGTWLAFTSSLSTGMVALHYFGWRNPNIGRNEVFGATLRVVISKGWGWNLFGSIIFTSSLAAFMSTADSAINGASCCVCLDMIEPYAKYYKYPFRNSLAPQWQEKWSAMEMTIISKFVSIIIAVGALMLNKFVDYEMGALLTMQNAVLCQVFPAYFLGMVTSFVQPYSILIGWAFGIITTLVVQCDNGQDDCVRAGVDWYWPINRVHPALFALGVNFMIAVVLSIFFSSREFYFDEIKRGHEFPARLVGLDITNTKRPYHWPNIMILVAIVIISIFAIPWYRDAYAEVETFKDGLPRFVRDGYIVSGVSTMLSIIALTWLWQGEPEIKHSTKGEMEMVDHVKEVGGEGSGSNHIGRSYI